MRSARNKRPILTKFFNLPFEIFFFYLMVIFSMIFEKEGDFNLFLKSKRKLIFFVKSTGFHFGGGEVVWA